MTTAAIYIRLSEEDRNKSQKTDESESIINQRSLLTEYASGHGWEIYQVYSDEDYSGSDVNRPMFNKMLADAKERRFNVVLCKSLSRFARDVAMVEKYINGLFIEWGIRFISLADYADSGQKGSRKNIQINSLVNQWYLEDLSENIKSVMHGKKRQGQFTGAFAPYGYLKDSNDKHQLVVDPEAAAVVRDIFSLYLAGYGNKAIANHLNNAGVPCPSKYRQIKGYKTNRAVSTTEGMLWSDHTVWHILRNPNYTGDLVQCRYGKPTYKSKSNKENNPDNWIVVQDKHEAIISHEEFERVQAAKVTRGAHNRNSSTNRAVANILAGIVKCKICGRSLVLSGSGKHNHGTRYLRCAGRKSGIVNCSCAMVKYTDLLTEVTDRIRLLIARYADFDKLAKHPVGSRDYAGEIAALTRAKDKCLQEQKRIGDALANSYIDKTTGILSAEDFATISAHLRAQTEELKRDNADIQAQLDKLHEKQDVASKADRLIAKYKDFLELDREIVRAFIDVVFIGERDPDINTFELDIHWLI